MWVHQKPGYIFKVGALCIFYTYTVSRIGKSSFFIFLPPIFHSPAVHAPWYWIFLQAQITSWDLLDMCVVVCVCVCVCVCAIKRSEHTRDLGKFSKWARCAFFTCISCSVSGKSSLFLFFPSISLQHPGWVSGLASLAEHPPGDDATTGGWGLEQQGRAACKSVRLVAFLPVCLPACLSACMSVCLFACLSTYLPVLRCLSDNLFAWQATCLTGCSPVSACQFICLPVCILVCVLVCLPVLLCLSACCLSVCLTRFLFCGINLSVRPWYNHYGWLGVKKQFLFPSFHGFGVPKGRHCFDLMLSGCKKQFPFPSFHGFCLPKGRHCFYLTCVLRACLCVCVCVCVCSCCVLNFETMSI